MAILTATGSRGTGSGVVGGDLRHPCFAMELLLGTGKDKPPCSGPTVEPCFFPGAAGPLRGGGGGGECCCVDMTNRSLQTGRDPSARAGFFLGTAPASAIMQRSFAGDRYSGLLFLLNSSQRVEIPTRRWEENKWKDIEKREDKGQNKLSDN